MAFVSQEFDAYIEGLFCRMRSKSAHVLVLAYMYIAGAAVCQDHYVHGQ